MKRVVHAACPHDCPDACGVLITIDDGRATRIQGDPEHPVTRGFLCAKVAKYLHRVYSPEPTRPSGFFTPCGGWELRDRRRSRAPALHKCGSASPGTKPSTKLPSASARPSPITDPNPSCPTPTEARSARSMAVRWIGGFSTDSVLHSWNRPSSPRRAQRG